MMAAVVAALAGLLGIGSAQAQVQASGSAALTSDYVWRGSSQSEGKLRATVHDTDNAAKRLFPGNAGGRWELALQGSF